MRLVQSVRSGELRLEHAATPTPGPTQVLVRTQTSLISAGTEKSMRSLASSSLIAKARARPDLVREVIDRAKATGLRATANAVRSRLAEDAPLGYSAAGIVESVGEAVSAIRPGHRVATAGAPHADTQIVAGNLVVRLPDTVAFDQGAFATVGSIALNGLRLSGAGPGTTLVLVGLGLVGQITARLAMASGARVAGVEPEPWKRKLAGAAGLDVFDSDAAGWEGVAAFTRGEGADAAIVTAATSSSDPMTRAAEATGDQGTVVLVGDAGMDLDRRAFYERELTLRVARSYGPGRYDPSYEELGIDYPRGHVRWTAQRNMEAVLDLVGSGRVDLADLITHRYAFDDALAAYAMLEAGSEDYLGIVLDYAAAPTVKSPPPAPAIIASPGELSAGLIGTGSFARRTLVPATVTAGFSLARAFSATGSQVFGGPLEGVVAASSAEEILAEPDTPVVFIATRHDSHAALTAAALRAGKHVFCEKPLALSEDELADIEHAWSSGSGALMVGFNRRWSPAVTAARDSLSNGGPLQLIYRVSAGPLPAGHWLVDRRMGGRLLGEACHFVDTCSAIIGHQPDAVTTATSARSELLLDQDFSVLLGYPDGSQATIVYSSRGSTRSGKERLEIIGGGHSIVIDDYQRLDIDGPGGRRSTRYRPADKGHDAELAAFAEVIRGDRDGGPISASAISTTRVMFAAVESAMTGTVVRPGS